MALELYHNDVSVCAQKVRLTLAEKELNWVDHHLVLRDGDHLTPEYLKLNPNGVVPTLIHDDRVITESSVINEYLDQVFPESALRPSDPFQLAEMRIWTKQIDDSIHTATGTISFCMVFRLQHMERTPEEREERINQIPVPGRRARIRQSIEMGIEAPAFHDSITRFDKLLTDIDAALEGRKWLLGDDMTLADLNYVPYVTRLEALQLHGMFDERPRLRDWYACLKARPSYQNAMTEWLNPFYVKVMEEQGIDLWPRIKELLAV